MSCDLAIFVFFSSRRRHTRWPRDWSSDVCSSDLKKSGGNATAVCQRVEDNAFHRTRRSRIALTRGSSALAPDFFRSEERRVGKECRSRWSPYHYKKNKTMTEL